MAKRVADNFIISDKNAEAIKNNLQTGTFGVRLFIYVFFYIILLSMLFFAISTPNHPIFSDDILINNIVGYSVIFGVPFLILYLKEKSIRKFRRKNGLSIYKNITEDLKQLEVDKRVAMEKKAYAKHGINQTEGL